MGIIQRVLPRYRAPFFDLLAARCKGGLSVFAGEARPNEAIASAEKLERAKWWHTNNVHFFNGPFYVCYQTGLLDWLDDWKPDVLIAEANPRYLSTPAAIAWMRKAGRPVIGWGLGAPTTRGIFAGWRTRQRKRFLSQFDAIIAYSQHGAVEYQALDYPAKRIFVAPNSVRARPRGKPPNRPARFAIRPTLLYVGRLQARKRLDHLLRTCASLPAKIQPHLVIVGDGPARVELEQLAKAIYPNTDWMGARYGKELDRFFRRADLFVLPGTGGLAVQQAMAHGLPVIVAEGDGSQQELVRPSNGWLVAPGNELALRTALIVAFSNPSRLRKMGEASFRLVKKEFTLENMAAAFVKALNRVDT